MGAQYDVRPFSTYFTLCSSSSHGYFPQNLNSSFTNKIVNQIDGNAADLEVALTDIYFTPSPDKKGETIFGHEAGDDKIKVTIRHRNTHLFEKQPGIIQHFVLSYCNSEFKKRKIPIHFSLISRFDGSQFFALTLNQPDYNSLRRRTTLAKMLQKYHFCRNCMKRLILRKYWTLHFSMILNQVYPLQNRVKNGRRSNLTNE